MRSRTGPCVHRNEQWVGVGVLSQSERGVWLFVDDNTQGSREMVGYEQAIDGLYAHIATGTVDPNYLRVKGGGV